MMWFVRLFFAVQPRFRPCDSCNPCDLVLVLQMADLLEARSEVNRKAVIDCAGRCLSLESDDSVKRESSEC